MATPRKRQGAKRRVTADDENHCAAVPPTLTQGRTPTPETVAAMLEAQAMTKARFATAGELFDALDRQASANRNKSR